MSFPVSENVFPDLLSLDAKWWGSRRTGSLHRVCVRVGWGSNNQDYPGNSEYTIIVTWALYQLHTIMAEGGATFLPQQLWPCRALSMREVFLDLCGGSESQELFLNFIWSHNQAIFHPSLPFSFKSILGNYKTNFRNYYSDIYAFSITHHVFWVFPRNRNGSWLFALAVVSDIAQCLGMDQS